MIKRCPGFPGYSVSDDGRVFSHIIQIVTRFGEGRESEIDYNKKRQLKGCAGDGGYLSVGLHLDKKNITKRIHSVVLEAFVGPRPKGMITRHLDGNKLNNNLSNLKYGTHRENGLDRIRLSETSKGEDCHYSKLTEVKVLKIRKLLQQGKALRAISDIFGIHFTTVHSIKKRKTWKHI